MNATYKVFRFFFTPTPMRRRRFSTAPAPPPRGRHQFTEIIPRSVGSSSDLYWLSAWLTPVSNVLSPNPNLVWNSRDFPPAWVGIDLGSALDVSCVALLPCMEPSTGRVKHVIQAGLYSTRMQFAHTYDENAEDNVWILIPVREKVRFIHISTLLSPSWVAWRRVMVCRDPSGSTED